MTAPFLLHLTRTPGGYTATSPEVRGVAVSTPFRADALEMGERTFRLWAGERGIEVVDLTGEQG